MAPPKFADLSKAADDLFSDDFGASATKVTFKAKAANGTNIKVEGSRVASGAVTALLETKFTHKASGVTVKEKWTNDNVVTTELAVKDKLLNGCENTLVAKFKPTKGGLSDLSLKTTYKTGSFTANATTSSKSVSPAGVFSYGNWNIGAGTTYNFAKGALSSTSVGVGYTDGDLQVASTIADNGKVAGSIFHKCCPSTSYGVKFGWNRDTGATNFAVATCCDLDSDAFVKAKVDTNLAIGLSYVQTMRPGVSLRLSADIAGNALNSDSHAVGLHLNIDN
jgi:voltage-dependent anion channel protein 2